MTLTAGPDSAGTAGPAPEDLVTLTIDGVTLSVPKGTLLIRAAELIGVQIPRFCDHPLLDPVGACRQCLVEVAGQRKPFASCTTTATESMEVHTQLSSAVADKAQQGVMELLLINHPLDCPICDKGGECPLQNQAMSNGRAQSRFGGVKRTFPKPIEISSEILLDRERCVLCARCTRFADQIAGDRLVDMFERGARQQVGVYPQEPFESYFSGNTVQICPVGALTSAAYRFRARPFDLVSTPSVCEHCASGCAQRTDHRRGTVLRRLAGDDPEVNEEWNCDKGRFAFTYGGLGDRITAPLLRGDDGALHPVSWGEALSTAAERLGAARGRAAVLTGGRLTWEDAYAYAKFARLALHTNDIDFRSRPHSAEEAAFLGAHVAGRRMELTYRRLVQAPVVVLVDFEPEEESPIVFLRLRKAVRKHGMRVHALAPFASAGLRKLSGTLTPVRPGEQPAALDQLGATDLLRAAGAVILVGERAATSPGTLTAAARLAEETGAGLAWIPRRAGDRGALEAGALPTLLPAGRPVTDEGARREVAAAWGVPLDDLPSAPGRSGDEIVAQAVDLAALVVAGVDLDDLPDPDAARAAVEAARFTVSIELRHSAVTDRADVVFPAAPVAEKSGAFLDWEGRARPFGAALSGTGALSDHRVLDAIAAAMGLGLGAADLGALRAEMDSLSHWDGARIPPPIQPPAQAPARVLAPASGGVLLTGWRMLLDGGRLQDGEPHLAGTARAPVIRLSAATASEFGCSDGELATLRNERGQLTLPVAVTEMPDRLAWAPLGTPDLGVHRLLGRGDGALVHLAPAEPGEEAPR